MPDHRNSASAKPRPSVEIVRQAYEAFRARDLPKVFGLLSPDVEFAQSQEIPWGGQYKGHDGARQFLAKLVLGVTANVTVDRYIDAGESVVAIGRTVGKVNATGAPFDVPIAHVWSIRNGLVVRVNFFIDNPTMQAALSKE